MSMKWISHRGESIDAPENTLASFKLSLERDTDGMECDIHLTKDGVVVVSHDGITARMGDANLTISESTWEELQKVNVSGANQTYLNEHLPLFEETLQYVGDHRQYYVELKPGTPELVPAVKPILEKSGLRPEQIVIISFDEKLITLSKEMMPQYQALWLTCIPQDMTAEQLADKLKAMKADGVDACSDEMVFNKDFVKVLHDAGMFVAIWTIDQPGQARRFKAFGVDSITSNRAALLRDLVDGK